MARKKVSEGLGSRKRNNEESTLSSNEPKKRRLWEKKDNYEQELSKKDNNCWTCHSKELADDGMWYFWPCCPRIYHLNCMSDSESETTCPECQLETVDGTKLSKPVPLIKLNELLLSIIQKYLDDKKGKKIIDRRKSVKKFTLQSIFVQWPAQAKTDLIKVVDFTYLTNKIRNETYSKASEFFSDVKWILHNCHLLYGAESTVTKDARELIQLIKADLLDIEACHECCYLGPQKPGFFIKLCNPPHQIIWAQIGRYPYWPAKCLKVGQETVYAKFFGEPHQIGKLSVSKCYYISRNPPKSRKPVPKTKSYNDSMVELHKYITFYELQRRESFKYYYDNIPFKPENAGKENQEIHLNVTGTLQEESSSPGISSNNLASDDLRLGADFSNLNHPSSELSDDQISLDDRPVTHTMPSPPSNSNQCNFPDDPQTKGIPSSSEAEETGSKHPVTKTPYSSQELRAAVSRFFANGANPVPLTPQLLASIINSTKNFIQLLATHGSSQREEELKKQIFKLRSEFEEEKKQLEDKIRNECENETSEYKDKSRNAYMLLRNIRIDTKEAMEIKEKECEKRLLEKDYLLEQYQEKLKKEEELKKKEETENIELKKELKNIEQNKEFEKDAINIAKRNLYCFVCLKSASILCCVYAAYCSKSCQTADEERHKVACIKETVVLQKEIIDIQTTQIIEINEVTHEVPKAIQPSSAPVSKLRKNCMK